MRVKPFDAQAALSFLVNQLTYVEPIVYATQYPDIQFRQHIPIDTSAPEWTKSVTFYSSNRVGEAAWFHHQGTDMRRADIERTKHEVGVEMAGIGYGYTVEEVEQARMQNQPITAERADAAKRASEEFIDDRAWIGDEAKGWTGLANDANVTIADAAATGTGGSASWEDKTGDQIAQDINDVITGVYVSSKTVEMANTILLPVQAMTVLATKRMDVTGSDISVMDWIRKYNVFTQITNQPLTIVAVRQLENLGEGGDVGRMVAYRKDPQVVKMHIPMPHRFQPVWQVGPLAFEIPGIMRFGGVEIRRPGAVRYMDGVSNYTS